MVPLVAPLWITAFVMVLPFLYLISQTSSVGKEEYLSWWQTKILLVSFLSMIVQELILWRSARCSKQNCDFTLKQESLLCLSRTKKFLILQWSVALWKGLFLGFVDALTKKTVTISKNHELLSSGSGAFAA